MTNFENGLSKFYSLKMNELINIDTLTAAHWGHVYKMEEYLKHYIDVMTMKGIAKGTIAGIKISIHLLFRFLKDRDIKDLKEVTSKEMDDFQTYLYYYTNNDGHPFATSTQATTLSYVKSFFQCLVMEGLLFSNPASEIIFPKRNQVLPRDILNTKELKKLFSAPDLKTYYGYRDRTIFEVFYSTGVRIAELCNLKLKDIDLENGFLTVVQGKGLKDRTVPLCKVTCKYLSEYIQKVRPHFIKGSHHQNFLFLSNLGNPVDRTSVFTLLHRYQKTIGLQKNLTGHTFRYTMATELLRNGADIRQIQEILGHEYLSTTQRYIQVVQNDLKKVHKRTHPREQEEIESVHFMGEER